MAITPFVLALAALVLDVRTLGSLRTDLARQTFALAEVIANETDNNPLAAVMAEAMAEFGDDSAGTFAVAVVTRGTERGSGVPCVDGQWCLPMVAVSWPPTPAAGTWNTPTLCPAVGAGLPAAGQHFAADQQVLPNEDDGTTPHQNWVSRDMTPEHWWIVVDTCVDPTPGLVWSGVASTFGFDLSPLALRRRAAFGSFHRLPDCNWCSTATTPPP
ncbi:MAG: hypothetical protein OXM56_13890 [Gammaproteobacteria bacterium]|nr:hypothetical protein [Gammaproteobacteria bacterium]